MPAKTPKCKGYMLYTTYLPTLEQLEPDDFKTIVLNCLYTVAGRETLPLNERIGYLWTMFETDVLRGIENYEKRCESSREAARRREQRRRADDDLPAPDDDCDPISAVPHPVRTPGSVHFQSLENEQMNSDADPDTGEVPSKDKMPNASTNTDAYNTHQSCRTYQYNDNHNDNQNQNQNENHNHTLNQNQSQSQNQRAAGDLARLGLAEERHEERSGFDTAFGFDMIPDRAVEDSGMNLASGNDIGALTGGMPASDPVGAGTHPVDTVPTLAQVREFCRVLYPAVDADRFYQYYQSRGWQLNNHKINSWQSLVAAWNKRAAEFRQSKEEREEREARTAPTREASYDIDTFLEANMRATAEGRLDVFS